jgi:hypothetical protein
LGGVEHAREALRQLFGIPQGFFSNNYDTFEQPSETEAYDSLKATALGQLLPDLEEAAVQEFLIPHHLPDDHLRGRVLAQAASRLNQSALSTRLDAARSVAEIGALAPYASQLWLAKVLRETRLKFIRDARAELISAIAPHLNPSLLQEALEILHSVDDPLGQAVGIAGLSSFLKETERVHHAERALAAAQATGPLNVGSRSQALVDIAPYLPLSVLRLAIADAKALEYDFLRARALGALLPALGAAGAVEEAWAEARLLDGSERAEVMSELVSLAPNHLLKELPRLAPWIASGYEGTTLLVRTAELLSASGLQDLFEQLLTHAAENEEGVQLLSCVARHTPTVLRGRVRRLAQASDQHLAGAAILARLAALSGTDDRKRLLAEAVERLTPSSAFFDNQVERAVAAIASATPADRMDEFFDRFASWPEGSARNEALVSIAPYLRLDQLTHLLDKMVSSSADSRVVVALVVRLARLGAEKEAQTRYLMLPSWVKARVIGEIAPYLTVQGLERTMERADWLRDEHGHGSRALCALGPHLVPDLLVRGLALAMEITDKFHRRPALQEMVRGLLHAPPATRLQALVQGLTISGRRGRLDFLYDLGSLAPLVAEVGGIAAVRASITAVSDCVRWWR